MGKDTPVYINYNLYKNHEERRSRNISEKFFTVRTFDYDDTDVPLNDLFETGAEERRNYLVMSFQGSGSGDNFFR